MEAAQRSEQGTDPPLVAAEKKDEQTCDHGALMRWITMMTTTPFNDFFAGGGEARAGVVLSSVHPLQRRRCVVAATVKGRV